MKFRNQEIVGWQLAIWVFWKEGQGPNGSIKLTNSLDSDYESWVRLRK